MALPELNLENRGGGSLRMILSGEWKLANSLPSPQAVDRLGKEIADHISVLNDRRKE
jgi:hypothetical protein